MKKDNPMPPPDSLVEILIVRAVVGEMIYEGPGTVPRQKEEAPGSKRRRKRAK